MALLGDFARRAEQPALRLVPAGSLHVTLAFLGETPEDAVPGIAEALEDPGDRVRLRVGEPAWLPSRRPRVLAIDLEDPDGHLRGLRARLAGSLTARGVLAPDPRPFRPHVTVARVRRGARPERALPGPPERVAFVAPSVTLYRSSPDRRGARYEPLARRDLP